MTSVAHAISNFDETLKPFKKKGLDSKKIIENIRKLRDLNPAVFNPARIKEFAEERSKAMKGLVDEFITAELTKKYCQMDMAGVRALKRTIFLTRTRNEGEYKFVYKVTGDALGSEKPTSTVGEVFPVEMPLFAWCSIKPDQPAGDTEVGSYSRQDYDRYNDLRSTTISVKARVPVDFGPTVRQHYSDAVSNYFAILSKLYQECGDAVIHDSFATPTMSVLWIPTTDSLQLQVTEVKVEPPPRFDPALIMTVRDRHYLVATWDIENEEPFEHFLREFSMGSYNPSK